jgi:kinesin family protein C1
MERPTALPKFQSRLMPPSKTNPLSELSDMATNARPEMPPPSGIPTKHKPPGRELTTSSKREQLVTCAVYEPVPKIRKTLAEQAGESYGSKMAAPRVKTEPANGIKTEPTGGSRLYQPSSSLSRVPPQKASKAKPTAANKFGGSVGYGARATSANSVSGRPKSAYGGHNRSKSAYQAARPATSNAQHGVEADSEPKGVLPFHISTNPEYHERLQVLKHARGRNNVSTINVPRNRPFSLNVSQKRLFHLSAPRAASSPSTLFPESPTPEGRTGADTLLDGLQALDLNASGPSGRTSRIEHGNTSGKNADISLKSKTPISLLPRPSPVKQSMPPPQPVPSTPTRAPTPQVPFVNRFTNDRLPAFFDDSRMAAIEAQFETFRENIQDDLSRMKDLKATNELTESRSMYQDLPRSRHIHCEY